MTYHCIQLAKEIFRAYDIRGLVPMQLNEHAFYTLGLAIGQQLLQLGRHDLLVGRDGRLTSKALARALCHGLTEVGVSVLDLNEVTTPMLYFATCETAIDSGLMVTGSHNPAQYNGMKIVIAGQTFVQEEIDLLHRQVRALENGWTPAVTQGKVQPYPIDRVYQERIVKTITLHRPFKVVVDCGNGIAGKIVPPILTALGCDVVPLYCEVDGRFPHHHPDPTVEENLTDLKRAVLAHKADLGLGFDGDGDRLGVVTNETEIIWPDRLMMFLVQEVLTRHVGGTIVFDVKCSTLLRQRIEASGGQALMCPTGHSIVKRVMREHDAPLAGEMSGHVFFKDRWYGFDDALYSAARLLELLSKQAQSVSEQFAMIPKLVSTPEIKIPIAEKEKFEFMHRFREQAVFKEASLIKIDGLRVEFQDGWGLLRASNTTPCLVARFEAINQDALHHIQALFKTALQQVDPTITVPF